MTQLKCPIYNSYAACKENPDCLFLREGGCAVILGMQAAHKNQDTLHALQTQIQSLHYSLEQLTNATRRLR